LAESVKAAALAGLQKFGFKSGTISNPIYMELSAAYLAESVLSQNSSAAQSSLNGSKKTCGPRVIAAMTITKSMPGNPIYRPLASLLPLDALFVDGYYSYRLTIGDPALALDQQCVCRAL
jgi:hypothetical protein